MDLKHDFNDWHQTRFEALLTDILGDLSNVPEVTVIFEHSRPELFQRLVVEELQRKGCSAWFERAMPSGTLRLVARRA